jgi:MOSC domain-containing protein YiiM
MKQLDMRKVGCYQIEDTASCQLPAEKVRGHLSRKASLMTRVITGGDIRAGDQVRVLAPS